MKYYLDPVYTGKMLFGIFELNLLLSPAASIIKQLFMIKIYNSLLIA